MKKSNIIGLIVIAIAVAVILSTRQSASSYVTFDEAYAMSTNGDAGSIHVVGELKKSSNGEIVGVNPSSDRLSVEFILVDDNHKEQKVFLNQPMPSDLLKSDKVVVIGGYHNDKFVADKVLLKCPSKYEETSL
ncbi:cytochrome c-type biogenesis protein CcmE [Roseivirga pacifica]|uniref:Cytochrome c-type biogenesis protein CcmE n=1 Tax=Roseivirga pacifica TaxID=1267423 RepID=A0A1I0N5K0_9BACT|nr:cytochrome c maturation protein CcmE [Roseivirga pacifica]MCO6359464.1 cytochrome c maturation protein CcmE [Roseivirga pacifica]MCO6366834.1 cytochrome c maturation protein CcmE [Roseivirga pacifica]MCO6370634.1 cytochrome c maturation protein CcmE [Roseivirga pacifica]MCO6374490.1 cytochrome c maturation protein CcmE [Roseivirga pacifica]MCO6379749.1 cytochrome c maturation protein CcmE [Roseivirga pacifica]|tara:strand:- start:526 stop:924 length:399 start_codon:yes stop_codon:yes gene_type:complete